MTAIKKIIPLSIFSLLTIFILPQTTYAVPPPDFLFNIGSSLAQTFSAVAIILSAVFGISYKYIKTKIALIKGHTASSIMISIILIGGISIGAAYLYGNYKQKTEYQKWLKENEMYANLSEENPYADENDKILREYEIDKLKMDNTPKILRKNPNEDPRFISKINNSKNDPSIVFIEKYYSAIANEQYEKAYEMSKKSINYDTYKSWYINTTKITLDNLMRIDEDSSSLELTLFEGNNFTIYGVLMTLKSENGKPMQIKNSEVKIIGEGKIIAEAELPNNDQVETTKTDEAKTQSKESFFEKNSDVPLNLSNSEFNKKINNEDNDYIVLDAREDLEYKNGYFPESTHIRFADLQAGKWIEIPDDKLVIVLCWSGIRGKEVAEFLRTKGIVAQYLENGANGWVEWGGEWIGSIKFAEKYIEKKYKKLFTTSEVKDEVSSGTILVDSREPWKFKNWHIPGSVNIPIMYTPTINLEEAFAQVPKNSTIITICDAYVNCFDAKITAVELEKRGHIFIGRYNKPWEYE